jgi:uncharacterized DUF497 family protein
MTNSNGTTPKRWRTAPTTASPLRSREVFGDPYTVYWADDRFDYDETRYSAIGSAQGRVLYVAYTMTDERVRIISARRAEPREQRRYHEAKT